ncbi:MAG: hypothetical protein ACE361_25675 [Aureliella sp.]
MGNYIEVNDTLQITVEQGFPEDVFDLECHLKTPITLDDVKGKVFEFHGKPRARVFHLEPVRVFLVQNIDGKWLHWGHAQIQTQTISKLLGESGEWEGEWQTSGTYIMSAVYDPEHQRRMTLLETPPGKSYFEE